MTEEQLRQRLDALEKRLAELEAAEKQNAELREAVEQLAAFGDRREVKDGV